QRGSAMALQALHRRRPQSPHPNPGHRHLHARQLTASALEDVAEVSALSAAVLRALCELRFCDSRRSFLQHSRVIQPLVPLSAVILTEVRRQPNEVEEPRVPSRRQERLRIFLGGPRVPGATGIPRLSPACALANDQRPTTNDQADDRNSRVIQRLRSPLRCHPDRSEAPAERSGRTPSTFTPARTSQNFSRRTVAGRETWDSTILSRVRSCQRLARISQLLRPLRRFHDGLDESHPQLPLLQ